MHLAVSQQLFDEEVGRWPPDLPDARGWFIHSKTYPILDCEFTAPGRTSMRLHCDFTDWDDLPPIVRLLSSDGRPLTTLPPNPTGVFNTGPHPTAGRPFICMAGSREFHTHSSHVGERWEQYRGKHGFSGGEILTKIWHAWLKGAG